LFFGVWVYIVVFCILGVFISSLGIFGLTGLPNRALTSLNTSKQGFNRIRGSYKARARAHKGRLLLKAG